MVLLNLKINLRFTSDVEDGDLAVTLGTQTDPRQEKKVTQIMKMWDEDEEIPARPRRRSKPVNQ